VASRRAAVLGTALALVAVVGAVVIMRDDSGNRSAPLPARELPADRAAPQLHGRILDANGIAVAGAHVRVRAEAHVIATTATNATGDFSFATLSSKRIRVEADADPGGAARSANLGLVEGTTTELTLVLALASVGGVVVDADGGQSIAGVALSVEGALWPVASVTSDAAGAFRFPVVPFEASSVVAIGSGYAFARVALGPREGRAEPMLRVELHRGQPISGDVEDPDGKAVRAHVVACEGQPSAVSVESKDDGTFELPASAAGCDAVASHSEMGPSEAVHLIDGRRVTLRLGAGGAIAGFVVDDHGVALDSFSLGTETFVSAHATGANHGLHAFKSGSFRLEHLVPGTYVLTAVAEGRPPARSDPIDVRAASVTDGVRIVVARGGSVAGRVLDDHNDPIAGVELRFDMVSAVSADSTARATTDARGRYTLEGAPAGLFTVRANKEGFRTKLVSGIRVASGETFTKDVTLHAGQGLELGGTGTNIAEGKEGAIEFAGVGAGDPADRSGVHVGDRILRIDGEDIAGLSVVDAMQRLRGEPGTSVWISVAREGAVIDVVITRGELVR
jgi:hypothetical protein